jgi:hypothetical protein
MAADRITLTTRTLAHVLDEHVPTNQAIDLLDVDCEGTILMSYAQTTGIDTGPRLALAEAHGDAGRQHLTDFL